MLCSRCSVTILLILPLMGAPGLSEEHEPSSPAPPDPRDIRAGRVIPDEGYCDQPYVVVLPDGAWLCTLTTGPGREGQRGQHVVATRSEDRGRTWSKLVDIEPSGAREASWIVPLVVPGGRVYGFYTFNGENVHTLGGKPIRADTLGHYAYRYSDDGGRTWSERCRLPLRVTACDRTNDWQGRVQMFWGIDKPDLTADGAVFAFTKLGRYMLEQGEGWVFRCDNIATERDPAKLQWRLLPEGDRGIRNDAFGSVQEEHNVVPLTGQDLYCVYRTTRGHPCHAYSRDAGRTWSTPEPMTYVPGGRVIKHPRACPMVWRTPEGRYLLWFHNNGTRTYHARNPVWIAAGAERDGHVHWSQPEILLYDRDPKGRMSYPDLIEQGGRYWVTETQKTIARVHPIDNTLLEGLWSQGEVKEIARRELLLDLGPEQLAERQAKLPGRLDLAKRSGLALDVWLKLDDLLPGQTILDGRDGAGRGFALVTGEHATVRLELCDGESTVAWESDRGLLEAGKRHHVVAVLDARPQIVCFVIDGRLDDGGPQRERGWTRYDSPLGDVTGSGALRIAPKMRTGQVMRARLYGRYLRTSEAVAHFCAGP